MKEKIAKIMRSGGYAVIIASIAMAIYLFVIDMGNKYMKNIAVPLKISIDENGYLSTNYGGDTKDVYVLWETDGGCIKPADREEILSEQYTEGNKWYFAYATPGQKVKWESTDADGNEYETANIRASVYAAGGGNTVYYVYDFVNETSITVTDINGKTEKADDRLFSNPVRKGDREGKWSQLYEVSADGDAMKTYRYRTGEKIEAGSELVLCFEANDSVLCETDLIRGTVGGFSAKAANSEKKTLKAVSMISFNPVAVKQTDKLIIEAFLADKSVYEKEDISDSEKQHIAAIEFDPRGSRLARCSRE